MNSADKRQFSQRVTSHSAERQEQHSPNAHPHNGRGRSHQNRKGSQQTASSSQKGRLVSSQNFISHSQSSPNPLSHSPIQHVSLSNLNASSQSPVMPDDTLVESFPTQYLSPVQLALAQASRPSRPVSKAVVDAIVFMQDTWGTGDEYWSEMKDSWVEEELQELHRAVDKMCIENAQLRQEMHLMDNRSSMRSRQVNDLQTQLNQRTKAQSGPAKPHTDQETIQHLVSKGS